MTAAKAITTGTIVRFEGGWYRVTRATKNTVNLGRVWGGKVLHKGVDIKRVVEDEAAWYANWSKSESYQCM